MLGQGLEQFNNLTGDIELNPQSFGLFMRDIEEASLALRTSIYSGNVNLTASHYSEMGKIAEQKYSLISTKGGIEGNELGKYYIDELGNFQDYDMTGKNPGLYMNHQRMGFWNGDNWNAAITNTGQAFFGNDTLPNYMLWNGTNLTIKGNIILNNGNTVQEEIDNIDVSRGSLSGIPYLLNTNQAPTGSGLKITATHLGFYNGSQWRTYMDNNGGLYLSGTGSNYLSWNGSTLTVRGDIQATSATFSYLSPGSAASDINNYSTTISGGKITSNSITANQIASNTITTSQLNFTPVQPGSGDNAVNASGKVTSINGNSITVSNISADSITTGILTGRTVRTAASGLRVELNGGNNSLDFYRSGGSYIGYLQGANVSINGSSYNVIRAIGTNLASENAVIAGTGFIAGNTSVLRDILPSSNNSFSLGASSLRWNSIHIGTTINLGGYALTTSGGNLFWRGVQIN